MAGHHLWQQTNRYSFKILNLCQCFWIENGCQSIHQSSQTRCVCFLKLKKVAAFPFLAALSLDNTGL